MQQTSSSISNFMMPSSTNMPTEYSKDTSCPFHENGKQQQSSMSSGQQLQQHFFGKMNSEKDLDSSLSTQRIAWSSSSSMSSLSTGSLFSLSDSFPSAMDYKTTGILFDNLDLVPIDSDIDPKPYACYNCWQLDHKCHSCPKVKVLFCQNCGRRGVAMKECPRCARAYGEYLENLDKQYNAFFRSVGMKDSMKEAKIVDEHFDVIVERSDESWDDCVEKGFISHVGSFLDYPQKPKMLNQFDDWDDYQTPRMNLVQKTTKIFSLYATKAEVAKMKNETWDKFEVDNHEYSWKKRIDVTDSTSYFIPVQKPKNKFENWNSFNQETCSDQWVEEEKRYELENERAEHESECWSNHGAEVFKDSVGNVVITSLMEGSTVGLTDAKDSTVEKQNSYWSSFTGPQANLTIRLKEDSLLDLDSKKEEREEDWNDLEECKSLQAGFCEGFDSDCTTIIDDTLDEQYWSDFDDDYQSLDESFSEDYKSLDNTADDENDCVNMLQADVSEKESDSGFGETFQISQNQECYHMFSYGESIAINNHYVSIEENFYHSSSLENSDDEYLSYNIDTDNYEDMIVDEDERSEPASNTGHAVQEFLNLLDSLKHFPIETQNLAVLHYISKCKEKSWQRFIQSSS